MKVSIVIFVALAFVAVCAVASVEDSTALLRGGGSTNDKNRLVAAEGYNDRDDDQQRSLWTWRPAPFNPWFWTWNWDDNAQSCQTALDAVTAAGSPDICGYNAGCNLPECKAAPSRECNGFASSDCGQAS